MIELREYREMDAVSNQKYANNLNVSRNLLNIFPYPYTIEDSRWWTTVGYKEIAGIHKAIDLEGECIGSIGITPVENEYKHSWEVAYWLGEPHWGKGYGTEALGLITTYAFQNTDAKRLFAQVLASNIASQKILDKCGYQLEGILKRSVYSESENDFVDEYLYAQTGS